MAGDWYAEQAKVARALGPLTGGVHGGAAGALNLSNVVMSNASNATYTNAASVNR